MMKHLSRRLFIASASALASVSTFEYLHADSQAQDKAEEKDIFVPVQGPRPTWAHTFTARGDTLIGKELCTFSISVADTPETQELIKNMVDISKLHEEQNTISAKNEELRAKKEELQAQISVKEQNLINNMTPNELLQLKKIELNIEESANARSAYNYTVLSLTMIALGYIFSRN